MLYEEDRKHLQHCLQLAKEAVEAGDQPFGSVLVDKNGKVLASERNRINELNQLAHPEYVLADWALNNLSREERKSATMYTSGEHCPMCAAAHGWAEIGRIVYIASAKQLSEWLTEFGVKESSIYFIPVQQVIKEVEVVGPVEEYVEEIRALHLEYHKK